MRSHLLIAHTRNNETHRKLCNATPCHPILYQTKTCHTMPCHSMLCSRSGMETSQGIVRRGLICRHSLKPQAALVGSSFSAISCSLEFGLDSLCFALLWCLYGSHGFPQRSCASINCGGPNFTQAHECTCNPCSLAPCRRLRYDTTMSIAQMLAERVGILIEILLSQSSFHRSQFTCRQRGTLS